MRRACEDAAGDDRALDLARALPDAVDTQLAIEAGGGVLDHVAATTERLHRAVHHAPGHLGGVEFAIDLAVHHLAIVEDVERVGGVVGEEPRRVQLGERIREREGDALVLGDGGTERLALLRPAGGEVDEAQGRAAAAGGDEEPLDEDPLFRSRVAARRHPVCIRHPAVAEDDLGVVVDVGIVEERRRAPDLHPRRARVDEEECLLLLRDGEHD